MDSFPQTIHFIGTNTPRQQELTLNGLEVEGEIPAEINGAFFRAVPDNAQFPMFEDDIALNADGMIAKFDISPDGVSFAIKYVETERYLAEKEAGRALFGRYRNPFTDDPSVAGKDRTVANTTPVWHAGKLRHDDGGCQQQPEEAQEDEGADGIRRGRSLAHERLLSPDNQSGRRRDLPAFTRLPCASYSW